MRLVFTIGVLCGCAIAVPALAQTGTLDQMSPTDPSPPGQSAWYNEDASSLTWQQQIRCGLAGTLEGITLRLNGNDHPQDPTHNDSHVTVRVRRGAAPSSDTVLFERVQSVPFGTTPDIFFDMSSAAITLAAGEAFVLETFGHDDGGGLIGNYVPPDSGNPPLYPEPLFLNGSVFVPGWRHGFRTYMLTTGGGCPADMDGNGVLNVQDFLAFLQFYSAGDAMRADFNHDGVINVQDFLLFLSAYAAGC
jgi:hypothetical protein